MTAKKRGGVDTLEGAGLKFCSAQYVGETAKQACPAGQTRFATPSDNVSLLNELEAFKGRYFSPCDHSIRSISFNPTTWIIHLILSSTAIIC